VAEDPDLVSGESNRAFVLMPILRYLRRNQMIKDTDHTGYDFLALKLDQFKWQLRQC